MNMSLQIIAELAQGFEGSHQQARLLMKAAATAGADAVKYQLVYADELATPGYKFYDLFKTLEMPDEEWLDLKKYSEELGIELHLEIFGNRSLELAEHIGAESVKLHGTDMNNEGLLNRIVNSSVHQIILGAGGGYKSEIFNALKLLKNKDVTVLLGFQGYPTPVDTNQIERIRFLKEAFSGEYENVKIGFADHADPDSKLSFTLPATAIGAGAIVIEKHLTLGKVMKMEDHESALNPDEFADFTENMKNCYSSLGHAKKQDDFGMSEQESDYRKMVRRHVVASRTIPPGKKISAEDVLLKRSDIDQPLTNILAVYGKEAVREIDANSAITLTDLKN